MINNIKISSIVRIALSLLAFILVMIFAPRLESSRIIFGVEFNTKTGVPGLSNMGFALLITIPALTYFVTGLVYKIFQAKNKED